MEKRLEPRIEYAKSVKTISPASESFFHTNTSEASWLGPLMKDRGFVEQLESRKKLCAQLENIFRQLQPPDRKLQEAISRGEVTEKDAAALYDSLSSLLEDDADYERVVLYLPFELLPNAKWQPASEELQGEVRRFRDAYLSAWDRLLNVQDVRANFVDGDVLDVESREGDLPRVVKAAHLIPKLLESGLIDIETVFHLLEMAEDDVLRRSVADTLPVLADMKLLREFMLDRIKEIPDPYLRSLAERLDFSAGNPFKQKKTVNALTLDSIRIDLREAFAHIDAEAYEHVTTKRKDWLRKDKKRKAVEQMGDTVKEGIMQGALGREAFDQLLEDADTPSVLVAAIDGMRKALEAIASKNASKAQKMFEVQREKFFSLWHDDAPDVQEALSKMLYRLHVLKVVQDQDLQRFGLIVPSLAGPFSENVKTMKKELTEIKDILSSIEKDSELSRYIYPIVLVFGSRVKGYGARMADIDVAVFVKPGTSRDAKDAMRVKLKKVFAHEKIGGQVVEFWLDKTSYGLRIHDELEMYDPAIGESSWTHVLFGAVWEGTADEVNRLREQLLPKYFEDSGAEVQGRGARGVYLEELERDFLQYRLMHKGYERFFPSYGGIHTPHAESIDGKSMFWDSGYRRMATLLFARGAFLPKISQGSLSEKTK